MARLARKSGLLSLEDFETRSRYLKQGLQMLADGFDQKVVKEMLDKERLMTLGRNQVRKLRIEKEVLKKATAFFARESS